MWLQPKANPRESPDKTATSEVKHEGDEDEEPVLPARRQRTKKSYNGTTVIEIGDSEDDTDAGIQSGGEH
jgi:hypothetical protein